MKLYEISGLYQSFLDAMEAGEITDAEAIENTLEAIEAEFNDKADAIACMIKSFDAEAAAIKAEAAALTERAKAKANRAESLRGYLSSNMARLGVNRIESARNKLSFRRSEAVEIINEAEAAAYLHEIGRDDCLTFTAPKVNKTAIKSAIKNGNTFIGIELVERQNLQIR